MSLKSDLYDVMKGMREDYENASDEDFATQVDKIIKDFASSLSFSTDPSTLAGTDTSPAGAFADGSAEIEWKFKGGQVKSKIMDAASKGADMKDDDLSQAIADGLDADPPTWTVTISGTTTTTTTPPQTPSSSDSGTVTSQFQSAPVKAALDAAFARMKTMTNEGDDGDDVFAEALANAVTTYYTTSINSCQGASHLAGVAFTIMVTQ